MRYCSNSQCERSTTCLRYTMGQDIVRQMKRRYGAGWCYSLRLNQWVAYRSASEGRRCGQYLDR